MKLAPKQIAQAGAATGNPLLWSGSKYTPSPNVAMALSGLDGSNTVGAVTIDAPTGISTIASGATTCVVTNSLATAYCKVTLEWYGDHGATRSWVVRANGSFTVTLSSAASANTSFGWTVSGITSNMLNGLIHYWTLGGNSNDAFVTGNGTDTAVTYTTPKLGSACAAFNGSTSKIDLGSVSKPLTWSMSSWLNPSSGATGFPTAWFVGLYGGTTAALFVRQDANTSWNLSNTTTNLVGFITIPNDAWSHVTITYDGVNARGYVNGALFSGPTAYTITAGTGSSRIGNHGASDSYAYKGLIDDVVMHDRELTAGEVASLYNSGAGIETMSGTLLTGLIHQWHLNGNSTDNVGSANGTDTAVTYGGKSGQCALFNNSTSKIQTAIDGPLGASPRSMSCWFNSSDATTGTLFSYGAATSTNMFDVYVNSTSVLVYTGATDIITKTTVPLNTWHHAVVTFDGTTTAMYIDGGTPTTSTATINTTHGAAYMQFGNGPTHGFYDGLIDEPAMWSRALTPAEVTNLYNAGAGRYYPSFA